MNAKLKKKINEREAYELLKLLKDGGYWDPVTTSHMNYNQCANKIIEMAASYFKSNKILLHWNINSYLDGLTSNPEIVPMMQNYNFNKYQDLL